MTSPALEAARKLTEISHLPPSMNGNPILYATTLTAVMCGVVLGLYVMCWMGWDTFRDRQRVKSKSVLFQFRAMMFLAGTAAFMACLPEVLYLQMYNDPQVSESIQAAVTTGKRIVDSSRIWVIIGWVGILTVIYPYVCLALMELDMDEKDTMVRYLKVEEYPSIKRLAKPAFVFIIVALIAMVFAISKVYGS